MTVALLAVDVKVLRLLEESKTALSIGELASRLDLDQSPVSASLVKLAEAGWVEVSESRSDELKLGARSEAWEEGLAPERRVARALAAAGGRSTIKDLSATGTVSAREVGESLRWLTLRNWAVKNGAHLQTGPGWTEPEPTPTPDEQLVAYLRKAGAGMRDAVEAAGIPVSEALELLDKRSGVIESKTRRTRSARLSEAGLEVVRQGLEIREEVTEMATDLLVSGRWREVVFRPYDVSLPGPKAVRGKSHPFRRILETTRRVFLEMGFDETASPWVESAFWDFDALFQPQDHPARDMQDTFYLAEPRRAQLPDEALVNAVGRTHEDGGETGSIGWRTSWDRQQAARCVLRTHTTAATIRRLAESPHPPQKVFSVGPVFRRETIDYKHLPVFHQVDGIVVDEKASFAALLTLLRTFYRKMGFEKIQFRPAFFPYTEPSVEVFVWLESRRDWVEMGGAGVFRPEVTGPLGCRVPVLAWGLGLERLAMFAFELSDIREIYLSHLEWLEEAPLCRS